MRHASTNVPSRRRRARQIGMGVALVAVLAALGVGIMLLGRSCRALRKAQADAASPLSDAQTNDVLDPQNTNDDTPSGASVNAGSLTEKTGKVNGIDVSKWQGNINWKQVKAAGIDFAIIRIGFRASDGKIYKDAFADYNLQQADAAGLLTGVYFYSAATNASEAKEEARWTLAAIKGYPISYPVVYDCEGFTASDNRMYAVTAADRTQCVLAFLGAVKQAGYEGMLYAAGAELRNPAYWDVTAIEKQFATWVAQYPATAYPTVETPDYDGNVGLWQYTNRGTVAGVDGNVDLNVSYVVRAAKPAKDAAARPTAATSAAPDASVYAAAADRVTAKDTVNLRDRAGTSGNIVATLKNGEFASRTGIGSNGWSKLVYNGQTVYAISSYLMLSTATTTSTAPTTTTLVTVPGNTFQEVNEQVTAKDTVNLRDLPSMDGKAVGQLQNGDVAVRTGLGDKGWSRLVYNGRTVYAVSRLLTTDTAKTTTAAPTTAPVVTVPGNTFTETSEDVTAKDEVNLRDIPSVDGKVVGTLKKGDIAVRTGLGDKGWSRLTYNGQTVYAITSYLTIP